MVAAPADAGSDGRVADLVAALAVSVVVAGVAGAISGFVWGGIGGRIAMRVLFLTSDDRVRGITSDDGFEIGRISGDTIFLIVAMTILGGVLGSFYGFARHVFDGSSAASRLGITTAIGLFSGATIVHTDGVDFRFLEPLWLSVGLFVALPALWAWTLVPVTERLLHTDRLPSIRRIDDRPLGRYGVLLAWAIILVMSAVGVVDLYNDYTALN